MASLGDVWGMYMGLKDRRRQKERDDVADNKYAEQLKQQSLANANTLRGLDNQDRSFNALETQRGVTNAANTAAVDLAADTTARGRAQGQMKSMITGQQMVRKILMKSGLVEPNS